MFLLAKSGMLFADETTKSGEVPWKAEAAEIDSAIAPTVRRAMMEVGAGSGCVLRRTGT